jgi:hypothetical protein
MSTIIAILEPDADGTLHLPLPPELRHGKVRVTAQVEAQTEKKQPSPADALKALRHLQAMGTFQDIKDPVSWQRESRSERHLPGRDA